MATLTIQDEAFTQLGPCVLVVDEDNVVRWVSERLAKLLGASIAGQKLDHFAAPVDRPFVSLGLRMRDGATLPLRGNWIPSAVDHLRVFVGAPAPATTEEMGRLGVTVDDFPEDDSWLNYLIQADECAATQNDARERIGQLKQERAKLNEARDQMRAARRAALNMLSDVDHARQSAEQAHAELRSIQQQLVEASRRAGMSEVATDVLHNVGNVLNSVNVSAGLVHERIRGSRVPGLAKATALMSEHADDLETFITQDERGKQLPGYLTKLAEHLADEQTDVLGELRSLTEHIEHIKSIVSMQQSFAGMAGVVEPVRIDDLLDGLLKMDAASFDRYGVKVAREYDELPVVSIDKHRLTQILVNLLKNARDALAVDDGADKLLTLRLRWVPRAACLPVCAVPTDPTALADKPPVAPDHVRIEVADNAVGIPPENLTRIFAHGFTTKKDGHGFGLHGSALTAKELGGSLTAYSDGPGQGATFTLELPFEVAEKSDARIAK